MIFLELHYMEQSGKATSIIVKKYGKDVFNFGTSFIECIMPFNIIDKDKYYRMIGKNSESNEPVNFPVNSSVNLNNTEKNIIELIKSNSSITIKEISIILNKEYSTIRKSIRKLKQEKKIIERIGSDKNGYWKIIK